ncbi:MAG TPA: hypothetical protein VIN75_23185 [Burkholderiaceae bacterium]
MTPERRHATHDDLDALHAQLNTAKDKTGHVARPAAFARLAQR